MKILITNTQGRSGTTLLQSVLSHVYKLDNLGEYIDYSSETVYNNTTQYLVNNNDWCCKMFFDTEFADYYRPVEFVQQLQPDLLVNSYREDLFDQYLSLQVSLHNKRWNSNSKLEYSSFRIADPEHSIQEFLTNIRVYESRLNTLRKQFAVYDISYEQLLDNRVKLEQTVDIDAAVQSMQNSTVKQNSKQEKFDLVENIAEVEKQWRILNDRT